MNEYRELSPSSQRWLVDQMKAMLEEMDRIMRQNEETLAIVNRGLEELKRLSTESGGNDNGHV